MTTVWQIKEDPDSMSVDNGAQMSTVADLFVTRGIADNHNFIIYPFELFASIEWAAFIKQAKMQDSIFCNSNMASPNRRRVSASVNFGWYFLVITNINVLGWADDW